MGGDDCNTEKPLSEFCPNVDTIDYPGVLLQINIEKGNDTNNEFSPKLAKVNEEMIKVVRKVIKNLPKSVLTPVTFWPKEYAFATNELIESQLSGDVHPLLNFIKNRGASYRTSDISKRGKQDIYALFNTRIHTDQYFTGFSSKHNTDNQKAELILTITNGEYGQLVNDWQISKYTGMAFQAGFSIGPEDSDAYKLASDGVNTKRENFVAYDYTKAWKDNDNLLDRFMDRFCEVLGELSEAASPSDMSEGNEPSEESSRSDNGGNGRRKRNMAIGHLKKQRAKNKADSDEFLRRKRFGAEMFSEYEWKFGDKWTDEDEEWY